MFGQGMDDFSELHIFQDKQTDFFAVICLHYAGKGPAIGGCRFIEYASPAEAVQDAIRLSKAMRAKAAISDLPHDGGKAVILKPKNFNKSSRLDYLKRFAECVDSLNGKYITTIDSGTTQEDMSYIKKFTSYAIGCLDKVEQDDNPSESTALGVYTGIQSAIKIKCGKDSLADVHVAIQGVGSVGYLLAKRLSADGAKITVADTDFKAAERVAQELNAQIVSTADIFSVDCDVFSPCALGKVLNDETIYKLKSKIVAGAANDQLSHAAVIAHLNKRDILFVTDYLINAGGLIHLAMQCQGKGKMEIENEVKKIGDRIHQLSVVAQRENKTLHEVAEESVLFT